MEPLERSYFLHDIVTDNARWAGDRIALVFQGSAYTWLDFRRNVQAVARGLAAQGVQRGTRVSILDRNSDRYVFLHYALASMGAILCPINMWLRASEIRYILERTNPTLIVTSEEFRDLAGTAAAGLGIAPRYITFGAGRRGDVPWQAVADGPAGQVVSTPDSWEDPHMILFTSGTTGRPKGAVISHRRSIIDGLAASCAFGIRRAERLYCYTPLFHTGSWDYLKLFFMNQGSAVLVDHFDADEAIHLIQQWRCNLMFGVPVVLRKMLESLDWSRADMSSMRVLAFGNFDPGNFLEHVLEQFRRQGASDIKALYPYGLTEGGPFVTIARPDDALEHPNTIGTPLPCVSVILLGEDGTEVPPGEIGEICVRSPALMSSYLDQPEATAEAMHGGWLHTGDLGRMDSDGFLHMVDRKKDMVRTGAENVYAREVEQLLVTHPAIQDVAVIGLPDPDYGEMVVAVVIPRPGVQVTEADVIDFSRRRIAGFKTPKRVVFAEDFPRTVTGKVAKSALRELVKADTPSAR